eukprot:TRINITY_DN5494_c0_g3_i2.p2 TRINITY_DN5494_c0_g3~~TRINITY_DN5494_c0_g3_i2.p2  ORF type:complete len:181 (+),score=83.16 TRINITY_DN5494_c0_g3_i2:749-1291(+)
MVKEQRKKDMAAKIMDENIMWKHRAVEAMREAKRREDLEALEVSKKLQEEERAQIEALKRERVKIANALNESYTIQEEMKKREQEKARQMDRKYCEMHKEKLSRDEKHRQRFFDYLRDKQEKNTAKEKLFSNRVSLGLLEQQRLDEERQIKAMEERERLESEKEAFERKCRAKAYFPVTT